MVQYNFFCPALSTIRKIKLWGIQNVYCCPLLWEGKAFLQSHPSSLGRTFFLGSQSASPTPRMCLAFDNLIISFQVINYLSSISYISPITYKSIILLLNKICQCVLFIYQQKLWVNNRRNMFFLNKYQNYVCVALWEIKIMCQVCRSPIRTFIVLFLLFNKWI